MKRTILRVASWACGLTLGVSPLAAHAAGCRLALAATVPLLNGDQDKKLLIAATLDGTPVRLVLDTGSESILLNETVARRAGREVALGTHLGGLDEIGPGFAVGVGGVHSAIRMQIGNLGLGRLHGSFGAMATGQSFASEGADGLLGMSVLGSFDVDLDLPGGQVRLYSASGACGKPAVALDEPIYAAPLRDSYHSEVRPLLQVVINGQNFTALLDTGSPDILLFASAAARLGLSGEAGAPATPFKISGVGGVSSATRRRLDTLSVGPITLRNINVSVDSEHNSEADLLLGLSFMRKVHVWISNSSHTLVMQFPPMPSPPVGAN